MAIRTVFLRFSSNANVFAADMTRVAAATKAVQEAGVEQAAAQKAADVALAASSAAKSKRVVTESAQEQALAEIQAARVAVVDLIIKAEGEAQAAATFHSAAMEREAEAAELNQAATLRQVESLRILTRAEEEQALKREAQLAVLKASEEEAAAAMAATAAASEAANAAADAALVKQNQAKAALTSRVGTFALLGGAAIGFGLYEAAKAAAEFEKEMTQAAAISDVTRNNLAKMSTEVLKLSTTMPVSASEFAQALTVAEQAGYEGYQAISLLRTAAEGATIGMTSTVEATKVLTTTLNGFGLEAKDATNVNNILVAAVQNGRGTYASFGEALSQAGPLARAAGISINDVASALSVMSVKGMDASGAGMSLLRMVFQMAKAGSATEKILVDLANSEGGLNVQTGAAAISALGLTGTLGLLGKATGGTLAAIEAISPSIRQARGALNLFSDASEAQIRLSKLMANADQLATNEAVAYAQQQGTTANQVKIATNEIQAAAITLGSQFLPVLASVAKEVAGFVDWLGKMNDTLNGAPAFILAVVAGYLLMFGIVTKLAPAIMALIPAIEGVEAASGPIGLIALGLTGLITLLGLYGASQDDATSHVDDFTQALKEQQSGIDGATATATLHAVAMDGLIHRFNDAHIGAKELTDAMQTGAEGAAAQASLELKLEEALGISTDALKNQGVSMERVAHLHDLVRRAIQGDKGALEDLNNEMDKAGPGPHIDNNDFKVSQDQQHQVNLLKEVTYLNFDWIKSNQAAKETQDALTDSTKDYYKQILTTGHATGEFDGSILALTDSEKEMQKAMLGFVDVGKALDDATKKTIDNQATFTTGADIFKDMLKDQQSMLDAQAQSQADAYNAALTDQTQAAQDAARASNEAVHDTVATTVGATKAGTAAQKELAHDATQANAQTAREISRQNSDARKSSKDFTKQAVIDKDEYIAALADSAQATKDWRADLDAVAANGGSQAVLDNLRKLGKDGVPLIHEFATASKDEIDSINASFATLAPEAEASWAEFQKAMLQQMTDENAWEQNLIDLTNRGGGDLAQQFIDLAKKGGKKSAGALAEVLKLSPHDLQKANDDAKRYGELGSDGYTQGFTKQLEALKATVGQAGTDSAQGFLDRMGAEFSARGLPPDQIGQFLARIRAQITAENPALAHELFDTVFAMPDALSNQEQRGNTSPPVREGKDQGNTPMPGAPTSVPQRPTTGGVGRFEAHGGFYPFANGSERHVAQFANGGDWRVWAEPETGGEAYIPLSPSKRGRSVNVLGAVASHFGYGLHRNGEQVRPMGGQLTGNSGRSGESKVTHVVVQQPISKTTEYKFTGPIHGYRLEQVTADADRKSRLAALSGGR